MELKLVGEYHRINLTIYSHILECRNLNLKNYLHYVSPFLNRIIIIMS